MLQEEVHVAHGDPKPSHVLIAIGNRNEDIKGALRTTFGISNTKEDIDFLVSNLAKIVSEIRIKTS